MTQSPKAPYSITTLPHGNAFLISVCEGNPLITDGFLLQISSYIELWCSLFCQPEQVIEKRSRFVTPWRDVTLMNLSLDKIDSGVTWWLWVTACHSIKYLCKQNNHNILQNMTSSRQSTLTQWMQKKTEWSLSEFISLQHGDNSSILIPEKVCGVFGDKPLPEPKKNSYELNT